MSKVKDLPSKPVLNDDDLLYTVDDSAGTNGGRKTKFSDLANSLDGKISAENHGNTHTESGSDAIPNATPLEGGLQSAADKTKLDSIETGAEVNQTDSEIKTQYENNADTNAFTDAEKNKLATIDTTKFLGEYFSLVDLQTAHPSPVPGSYGDINPGAGQKVVRYVWDNSDSSYIKQLGEDDILTDAEIKTQYENNANTNAFTDSEKTKLAGIETGAEVNQTDAEIKTQYENNADTNAFTDAEKTKLNNLETSKFLGEYFTLTALQTAHPSPVPGSYGDVNTGAGINVVRYVWDDSDGIYVRLLNTDDILTDSEIKTQYESNADTNAFTDAEQSKLAGIETGATQDQNSLEVPHDPSDSTLSATNVKEAIDELDTSKEPVFTKNTAFNKNFGTIANTVAEGDDKRFVIQQRLKVSLDPGYGEFSDIQTAIDSITDASPSKPYQVSIGPGVYEISSSIVMKPYIDIIGERASTTIKTTNETIPCVIGSYASSLSQIKLTDSGVFGTDVALIEYNGGGSLEPFRMGFITFGDCHTMVKVSSVAGQFAIASLNTSAVTSTKAKRGFVLDGEGGGLFLVSDCIAQFTQPTHDITEYICVTGPTNRFIINNSITAIEATAQADYFARVENGANFSLQSVGIDGYDTGLYLPNIGSGPLLNISSFSIINPAISDVIIENPNATGFINGAFRVDNTSINESATIATSHSDPGINDIGFAVVGDIVQGKTESEFVNLSRLARTSTLGLESGGALTKNATALDLDVQGGIGFILDTNDVVQEVNWADITLTIPSDSDFFITVNANGVVQLEGSLPGNYEDRVILGRVISNPSAIIAVIESSVMANQHGNKLEVVLRDSLGAIFVNSGAQVTENVSTNRSIDITSGNYYYGSTEFNIPQNTATPFNIVYRDGFGGFNGVINQTIVPNNQYDDGSGVIASIPAGKFVTHILYATPQEAGGFNFGLALGQALFDTLGEANDAPLPNLPPAVSNEVVLVASIVVQEGVSNIQNILDIRPRLGFTAAATTSVTDHGGLTGLSDDDHPQYFRADGTRVMTGNFDLGGNDIVNAGTIPGLTTAPPVSITPDQPNTEGVSSDKARADHVHNIPAATAVTINADSANAEGTANSFTRADHTHNLDTAAATTQNTGQTNTEGTSPSLARADHKHNIPTAAATTQSPDQANAEGASNSFARADHVHNFATATAVTLDADSTNGAGATNSFARSDHTHNLSTGVVSTQSPDQANAEGTSNNLARADHVHNIPTDTAVTVTPEAGNQEGISTSFARADHVHDIPSGVATTIGANSTNTEGVANAFARTDHTHDLSTGVVVTQSPNQANAEGTSNNLARADHVHNIPTAAPGSTGSGNSEGTSSAFARADHTHNTSLSSQELHGSTVFTTTSNTDVLITGFQLTPTAGTYLVLTNLEHTNSNNNRDTFVSIFSNGTKITTSERQDYVLEANSYYNTSTMAITTVNGSQTIDVRVRRGQNTLSIKKRSLILVRIG